METSELIAKYDLLLAPKFFDASTCGKIIEQLAGSPCTPATVYGRSESGAVDERVRRTSRLTPSQTTLELVTQRLLEYKETIEQHFRISLTDCEEPQFLRYNVGDFFVAHQDGNTGMLKLTTDATRKISITIFLNAQSNEQLGAGYCGGSLKFSNYRAEKEYREFELPSEPGLLVAFRSELTHEVIPITHGERYSIVSWYR